MTRGSGTRAAAAIAVAGVASLVSVTPALAVPGQPVARSFVATGSLQPYVIPSSPFIQHVSVTLAGGSGADGGGDSMTDPGSGGLGARVGSPSVPISQGETLNVAVGQAGHTPSGSAGGTGGTSGGALGAGGAGGSAGAGGTGGGGGGAATMLLSSALSPLVVAAGGGGAGGAVTTAPGQCATETGSDGGSGSANGDLSGEAGTGSGEGQAGAGATGSGGGAAGGPGASPGTAIGGGAGAGASGSGGGGGGGGSYGGGGGGRGGTFVSQGSTCVGAGGGAGSGSGLGPAGTSYDTTSAPGDGTAVITYIDPAITTVSLAATPNPAASGASVTITTTVAPSGGSEPAPSGGTVQFSVDGQPSGPAVTVSGGNASTVLPPLAVGSHQISASYSGADGYQNSSASPIALTVAPGAAPSASTAPGSVAAPPPHTAIALAPGALVARRAVAFAFSSDQPGSTFRCRLDGAAPAPCPARLALSALRAGTHRILVQAISPHGVADPNPATVTFTVDVYGPPLFLFGSARKGPVRGDAVQLRLACGRQEFAGPCVGHVRLSTTRGSTLLGAARVSLPVGRVETVRIKLNHSALARLKHQRVVHAVITLSARDAAGNSTSLRAIRTLLR